MTKATIEVLESIARLSDDSDFKRVVAWIRESNDLLLAKNISVADEIQLRWNQGKLQNMNDILRTIEDVLILLDAHKSYVWSSANPDI